MVVSALDTETGRKVAIKKIHDIFSSLEDAKRIVREVRILRSLHHPHIIRLRDAVPPDETGHLSDVYLVTDLMPTDLHRVIYSRQELTLGTHQHFPVTKTPDLLPRPHHVLMAIGRSRRSQSTTASSSIKWCALRRTCTARASCIET